MGTGDVAPLCLPAAVRCAGVSSFMTPGCFSPLALGKLNAASSSSSSSFSASRSSVSIAALAAAAAISNSAWLEGEGDMPRIGVTPPAGDMP